MKNKGTLIAGLGLGAAFTLSVLSFSSANETDVTTVTTTPATTVTKTMMPMMGAKAVNVMHGGPAMMGHGGMFTVRFGGPVGENSAMQDAITNSDYNAFVNAWNAQWSAAEDKPENITVPTQEMFNQMVAAEKKRAAIETALETNDYDGYVKATTPTRDEFTKMAEMHTQQKAIHEAIEAKDYDAFVTAAKNTPMAEMTEEDFENMTSGKMMKLEIFEKRADKMNNADKTAE